MGAIVGAIFGSYNKIWNLSTFIYRYFFVKTRYEGTWFSYHWTYLMHKPQIISSKLIIKKGIWSPYSFNLVQVGTNLIYNGEGRVEGSHLVLTFKATGHEERTVCRFQDILQSKNMTSGLWLSYDHDKNVASGGIILSKTEISEPEVNMALSKNIKSERQAVLLCTHNQNRRTRKT